MFSRVLLTLLLLRVAALPQTSEHFITVGGVQRRYLLHVPPDRKPGAPAPLIFVLHGGGSSPENASTVDIPQFSDGKGFLVVYPEGLTRGWNDGRDIPGRAKPDDVAFFAAMIDELVRTTNVDPKRIYATGMSNGGFMSFRLACDLADKLAAIAPVAGSMSEGSFATCKPERPISVLMINGTDDPLVHWEGGPVARGNGRSEPVPKVAEFWRKIDGCATELQRGDVPDRDPNDGSTVRYERCAARDGVEVINYIVTGGGHTWPGGRSYAPKSLVGNLNRDFDASEVIVEFFARH
jgi:polyhydroxybutyrate depolymerase